MKKYFNFLVTTVLVGGIFYNEIAPRMGLFKKKGKKA
jgi:hypothetical protein